MNTDITRLYRNQRKRNITFELEEYSLASDIILTLNHDTHMYIWVLWNEDIDDNDFDQQLEFCENMMIIFNDNEKFATNMVFIQLTFRLN